MSITTTADTTSPPIMTNALAALLALQSAEREGLPLPYAVTLHAEEVSLQFRLPGLTEWAIWLDAPIETFDGETALTFHHRARVEFLDWPLTLVAVTRGEAVA